MRVFPLLCRLSPLWAILLAGVAGWYLIRLTRLPEFSENAWLHSEIVFSIIFFSIIAWFFLLYCSINGRASEVEAEVKKRTSELTAAFATQQLTEAALISSEGRLAEAQRIANIGYWEWDPVSGEAFWTQEVSDTLGIDVEPDHRTNEHIFDRIHPEDREVFDNSVWHVLNKRERQELEVRVIRPDGEERWVVSGLVASLEEPLFLQGTLRDVTSKKQSELETQAAIRQLNEAQRIAKVGSFVWRTHQKTAEWSDQMYRLLGYEPRSLPSTFENFFRAVHPEDQSLVQLKMYETTELGAPYDYKYRVIHPGGEVRILRVDAVIERDQTGRALLWRGTNTDITEHVRAEEERRYLDQRLQETQRLESLGVLAGGVAHDFNNLMAGVLGNASLLRELIPPDSSWQDYLIPIEKAAAHASSLCQQLLAYAGKGSTHRAVTSLNQIVGETRELVRLAVGNHIRVNYSLDESLPLMEADESQIRQVVLNLVTNAAEAMGSRQGEVEIRSGWCKHAPACTHVGAGHRCSRLPLGRYVWLEVSDQGSGMPPETMARIFDPFFSTKFTGRGLGLSAVLGISMSHGGAVCVSSRIGQGSTFRIYLAAYEDSQSQRTPMPSNRSTIYMEASDFAKLSNAAAPNRSFPG